MKKVIAMTVHIATWILGFKMFDYGVNSNYWLSRPLLVLFIIFLVILILFMSMIIVIIPNHKK